MYIHQLYTTQSFCINKDTFVSCVHWYVISCFCSVSNAHLECSFFENCAKQIISKMIISIFDSQPNQFWIEFQLPIRSICDPSHYQSNQSNVLPCVSAPFARASIAPFSYHFRTFIIVYIWCLIKIMRHFHKNPFYFDYLNHLDCRFCCCCCCCLEVYALFSRYFGASYDKLISLLSL